MTGESTTTRTAAPQGRPHVTDPTGTTDAAELVLEDRFSIVPEWVLDADIGDCALRLYAVLLRYGNTTGARMPARTTLAARLHKKSVDTIDRALTELVQLGAVQVEPRWAGRQRLTNRYRIRTSRPGKPGPAPGGAHKPGSTGGGRTNAATPQQPSQPGRKDAAARTYAARGSRTDRGRVAARMRPNRESPTQTPPPPAPRAARGGPGRSPANDTTDHWQARRNRLLSGCGIVGDKGWDDYVSRVHHARRQASQPLSRWTASHLVTALELAVRGRGWPADQAAAALLQVAADPTTRSPARLAEAGPWWDQKASAAESGPTIDTSALEAELNAVDGQRLQLQQLARQQLTAQGQPVTRIAVIQRAVELLHTTP